jgi:hypothetical protein
MMNDHIYLRAYTAGVTAPTVLVVFVLASFVALRLGYDLRIPIERGLVFPLAIVPGLWGLWNMLYIVVRRHWRIPLGVHGALVPLFAGPLALLSAPLLGFDIPHFALAMFSVGIAVAMLAYYLVWEYLVGFFNRMLDIG